MANAKKEKKPVTPKTDPLNKRSRSFELLTYIDIDDVRRYCLRDNVSNYAYIVHDMDVYEEDAKDEEGNLLHIKGDRKEPHIHVVVTFKEARTLRAVSKDFCNFEQNTRSIITKDLERSLMYLTHEFEENKYKYSRDKVTSTYAYFNGSNSGTADNIAVQILNDMDNGIAPREMVRRYGRDYVIHFKQYREMWHIVNGRESGDVIHDMAREIQAQQEYIDLLKHNIEQLNYALGSQEALNKRLARVINGKCSERVPAMLTEVQDNTQIPFQGEKK